MSKKFDFDIDGAVELYNHAKKLGYEFYLTKFRTYSYIIPYNPSYANGKPYDPTKEENYTLLKFLSINRDISKFEIIKNINDLDSFLECSLTHFWKFSQYGSGKLFAEIYNDATPFRKPHIIKNITFYIKNNLDYVDLAELFINIKNLNIKEAKNLWNGISKIDFKITDKSSIHYNSISYFLDKIYSHFDFDFAHKFVLHITNNRSAQINSSPIFSINLRNFLVEYYTKNNHETLLNDFSKHVSTIKSYLESKDDDYMVTNEKRTLKQHIDYKKLSNSLLVDSWDNNFYVMWHRFLPTLLEQFSVAEEAEILLKKNDSEYTDSSLFVIISENSDFTHAKLNKLTKNYFNELKAHKEHASKISETNDSNNIQERFKFAKTIFSKSLLEVTLEKKETPQRSVNKI